MKSLSAMIRTTILVLLKGQCVDIQGEFEAA